MLVVLALAGTSAAWPDDGGPRDEASRSRLSHLSPMAAHVGLDPAGRATPVTPPERRALETPDPDDCFICHDDDSMTMERNGREISIYVSPDAYGVSQHGAVDCVECHVGYDPDEEPHTENPQPVDCSGCHARSARGFGAGAHRSELSCSSCHSNVHSRPGLATSRPWPR